MEKLVNVSEAEIKEMFEKGSHDEQTLLTKLFPSLCKKTEVMDRIKSFEDSCEEIKFYPNLEIISTKTYTNAGMSLVDAKSVVASIKLSSIVKGLNEGIVIDYKKDKNFYSIYCYQDSRGGFGFFGSYLYFSLGSSGSGFYLKSEKLVKYLISQFPELLNDYFKIS